jgi:hypothetical protein
MLTFPRNDCIDRMPAQEPIALPATDRPEAFQKRGLESAGELARFGLHDEV